jgi:hypothetical protein
MEEGRQEDITGPKTNPKYVKEIAGDARSPAAAGKSS